MKLKVLYAACFMSKLKVQVKVKAICSCA